MPFIFTEVLKHLRLYYIHALTFYKFGIVKYIPNLYPNTFSKVRTFIKLLKYRFEKDRSSTAKVLLANFLMFPSQEKKK